VTLTIGNGGTEGEHSVMFRADNTINGHLTTTAENDNFFSSKETTTTDIEFSPMMSSKMMPSDEFVDIEHFLEYDIPNMKIGSIQKLSDDENVLVLEGGEMEARFIPVFDDA